MIIEFSNFIAGGYIDKDVCKNLIQYFENCKYKTDGKVGRADEHKVKSNIKKSTDLNISLINQDKCIIDYYYIQSYKSDFGILIVFSLFLFFYIFVNNLVLTKNKIICGSKNQNIAFFSTLFPFVFIYVIGVVMITILPGWVRSFSNTFGLSVAKLCGMTTLTDYLFSNENKTSTINKKEGDYEFRKMVENQSDNLDNKENDV